MSELTREQVYRREVLAHCLWMAEKDEVYARWASRNYERMEDLPLKGLGNAFDKAFSAAQAKRKEVANA